jgi:predicted nucleic acid-binding protein
MIIWRRNISDACASGYEYHPRRYLARKPFVEAATQIWEKVEAGELTGYVTPITVANVFYVARKQLNIERARQAVRDLVDVFDICAVDAGVVRAAMDNPSNDFEDCLQAAAAEMGNITVIVTRDRHGFVGGKTRVFDPDAFLATLGSA